MPPPLRFVHASDTHLGYRQYGLDERLNDWNRVTREIIDYAIENSVDCVVHSGDLFNSNKVDHTSLIQAIEMLKALRDAEIPFLVIEGNHDRRKGSQAHTALDVLQSLDLCRYLHTTRGSIENAMADVNGTTIVGLGYHGSYLKHRLAEFYEQMPAGHNVVMLHASIAHYIEGGQPEITLPELEVLRPKTAYLALGHYHNKFSIDNWIFNPGSPEYYRFSDHGTERCFYDVVLRNGVPEVAEINVRGARRMVNVIVDDTGDDGALLETTRSLLDEAATNVPVSNSLLRVIVNGTITRPPHIAELKQHIEERYRPLYCTILDNTIATDDVFAETPGTLEDLEKRMFEASFAHYDEQASDMAAFARALLREILDGQPSNTDEAEPIAQHVSRFRREHL